MKCANSINCRTFSTSVFSNEQIESLRKFNFCLIREHSEIMLRDHLNQQYKSGLLKKDFENVDFMTISALAYKVAGDMNGLEDLEQ